MKYEEFRKISIDTDNFFDVLNIYKMQFGLYLIRLSLPYHVCMRIKIMNTHKTFVYLNMKSSFMLYSLPFEPLVYPTVNILLCLPSMTSCNLISYHHF